MHSVPIAVNIPLSICLLFYCSNIFCENLCDPDTEVVFDYYHIAFGNTLSVYEQIDLLPGYFIQNNQLTFGKFQNILYQLSGTPDFY